MMAKVLRKNTRVKALKELASIRRVLHNEMIMHRIAQELDPMPPSQMIEPDKTPVKTDMFQDMTILHDLVSRQVKTVKDLYRSMGFWSADNLLGFTLEQRSIICKALIDRSKALGIKPKNLWVNVLKDPMFYEDWSAEVYEEGNVSLSEVLS